MMRAQPKISIARLLPLVAFCGLLAGWSPAAQGQLFGPRSFGQPLSRQAGPEGLDMEEGIMNAGSLTGGERFLRENRDATDFVGADRTEASFVGAGQVINSGRVRSAIESLQNPPDRSQQLNQVWAPAGPSFPYPPRIQIQFEVPPPNRFWVNERPPIGHFQLNEFGKLEQVIDSDAAQEDRDALDLPEESTVNQTRAFDQANRALTRKVRRSGAETLEVFLDGRIATVRGIAANEHQKQIAGLLLGFEPGIAKVQNEIVVAKP